MEIVKIRSLYHHPLGERGIGKWIVAWTWILGLFYNWKVLKYNYSHEEVWVPNENGNFVIDKKVHPFRNIPHYKEVAVGQCFSSTTRGDAEGVRFAPASEVLKHPERWDYIEFDVDPERLEVALEEAKKLVGGGYDYGYVISFLQPFIVQKDGDWACSEICNWFKGLCRVAKRDKRISPRRSAYLLAKRFGEPIPLGK